MLLLTLIWLAIIDSINPTTIAIAILIIFSNASWFGWVYTSGVLLTTWIQGITFYLGAKNLLYYLLNWQNIAYTKWLLIITGIGVFLYGLNLWNYRYKTPKEHNFKISSSRKYSNFIKYLILGSITTFADMPTAFLLIIATVKLQEADVNSVVAILYLFVYAIIYVFPIIVLIALYTLQQERMKMWLGGRLKSIYARLNIALSVIMVALGIFIFAKGISMFII